MNEDNNNLNHPETDDGFRQGNTEQQPVNPKKMKQCSTCGRQIAKSARTCPYCGAKQKKPLLARPGFWILIILLIIIAAASCSGSSDSSSVAVGSSTASGSSAVTSSEAASASSTEASATETETDSTINVGDTVEIDDNIKMTLLSAGEYDTGNEFLQPSDGKMYYGIELEFENTGSSDETVSSIASFNAYADDYQVDQSYVNEDTLDGTISPGKKLKGHIVFEVPQDFKTLQVDFTSNFWTDKKMTMTFENK